MTQESVIKIELDWIEDKVSKMMKALEKIDIENLEDRTTTVISPKGLPVIKVIADIEKQQSAYIKLMREIMDFLPQLKKLREENQTAQIEMKGGSQLNGIMRENSGQCNEPRYYKRVF